MEKEENMTEKENISTMDGWTEGRKEHRRFYKEPKKFEGGELYFPDYDYEVPCTNNSTIILPGWVKHGVKKVSIKDSDYYDGWGRYCISSFFCCANQLMTDYAGVT